VHDDADFLMVSAVKWEDGDRFPQKGQLMEIRKI
jgi:hypothetical protein